MERFFAELRSEIRGDTLVGRAAVFGQAARLPAHWEAVGRNAFDRVLRAEDLDVPALVNHDPSKLLGRTTSGTLRLAVDDEGLGFEVDLPDTRDGADLRTLVARGDISGASFGFLPGEHELSTAPDGRQLRTHTSIARLLDVSPVTYPAYPGTSAQLRSLPSVRTRLARARARLALGGIPV